MEWELKYPPWNPNIMGNKGLRQYWKKWNHVFTERKKYRIMLQCYTEQKKYIEDYRNSDKVRIWF